MGNRNEEWRILKGSSVRTNEKNLNGNRYQGTGKPIAVPGNRET